VNQFTKSKRDEPLKISDLEMQPVKLDKEKEIPKLESIETPAFLEYYKKKIQQKKVDVNEN